MLVAAAPPVQRQRQRNGMELLESERWSFSSQTWQPTNEGSLLTRDPPRWVTRNTGKRSSPPCKLWLNGMEFNSTAAGAMCGSSLLEAARWAPLYVEGASDADGWRYAFDFKALEAAPVTGAGDVVAGTTDVVRQRRWRPLGHPRIPVLAGRQPMARPTVRSTA